MNRLNYKKENLKQRAYLNSVTSVLDYGAKLVTSFFVTPFLVSGLGSTIFGVWKVLEQFANYTSMADIKATEVLKWAVAKDRETIPEEELRRYVTTTFILVLLILPFLLIAGAILTWFSPTITGVEPEYANAVRITTALLVLSLIIHKVFGIFESILRGMNLGFKRMGFRAAIFIIGGILQVTVILYGYGIIALAVIQVLVYLLIGTTVFIIVKRHVPWFGFEKTTFKKSLSFFKTSGWFMSWTGTKLLLLKSDKILLGFLAGPIYVTQYVITEYMIKAVQGIINNVIHGVLPGMGKLYGTGELEKMNQARNHIMLLTWLLAVIIGSLVIAFNEAFIKVWIGEDIFAGQLVNILILLVGVQYLFFNNDSTLINLTLEIKHKVFLGLAAALVSIGLAVLLIDDYGVAGLCVGLIIGRGILSYGYPYIINRKINKKISLIPMRCVFATLIIWGGTWWISEIISVNNWAELIFFIIIYGAVLTPISFFAGINKENRNSLYQYRNRINLFSK